MPNLHIKILTIFPELFPGPLIFSVIGSALDKKLWSYDVINIRDFSFDKHKRVDDTPFGGGGGMLIKPDVLSAAIDFAQKDISSDDCQVIYMSPRGKVFNQVIAGEISKQKNIILICGRFEGIDQRVIDYHNITEISIGDYVLTGGEIAAYAFLDACIRLIPGVLGNDASKDEESFSIDGQKLLEYPQYTKPAVWNDLPVPQILLSGNHKKIKDWRVSQAKAITKKKRPDLF